MKKLHIFMLSAAFLFGGLNQSCQAETSLADVIMPFPTFALGAAALYMLSGSLDVLDKTTKLGEILDKKTATDSEKRLGLKPQSFLHKWSLITELLSKTALGVAMLPITSYVFLGKFCAAIAKNEF